MKVFFAATVASIVTMSASAGFSTILVDYGSPAADPTLGGTWNVIADDAGQALDDIGGAGTGVSISFGGDGWIVSGVDQGPWPSGDSDWVDGDATADYIFNTGGDTSTVVFSGLTPGAGYMFDHVAARVLGADRRADYLVNGSFADSTPNGDDFFSLGDGWDGGNILTWNNVIADGNGEITLTVTDVQGFGYISASRLQVIPAPGAFALLGIAGFASRRRRRTA